MIQCVVASQEETTHYGNLKSITLPALDGLMEILPHHAEAFFMLVPGKMVLRSDNGQTNEIEVKEGCCHVRGDQMIVIL